MTASDITQIVVFIIIFGMVFLGGALTGAMLATRKMTQTFQRAILQERLETLRRRGGPPTIPFLKLGSAWHRSPGQPPLTEEEMAQLVAARRARSRARIGIRLDQQIAEAIDPNFDPRRNPQ